MEEEVVIKTFKNSAIFLPFLNIHGFSEPSFLFIKILREDGEKGGRQGGELASGWGGRD